MGYLASLKKPLLHALHEMHSDPCRQQSYYPSVGANLQGLKRRQTPRRFFCPLSSSPSAFRQPCLSSLEAGSGAERFLGVQSFLHSLQWWFKWRVRVQRRLRCASVAARPSVKVTSQPHPNVYQQDKECGRGQALICLRFMGMMKSSLNIRRFPIFYIIY